MRTRRTRVSMRERSVTISNKSGVSSSSGRLSLALTITQDHEITREDYVRALLELLSYWERNQTTPLSKSYAVSSTSRTDTKVSALPCVSTTGTTGTDVI